jgi:outer membrane protein assembly factor BamB
VVYNLDINGEPLWSFKLEQGGGAMDNAPAYSEDVLYFGGQGDDHLYAVDSTTGELLWKVSGFGSLYASPILVDENLIYGFGQNQIVAVDKDGLTQWSYPADGWGGITAIWKDVLVAASWNTPPIAFDKRSGEVLWQREDLNIVFTDLVTINDQVFLGVSGSILALEVNEGRTMWETSLPIELAFTDVTDYQLAYADGILIAAGGVRASEENPQAQNVLMALDAKTGELLWYSEPAVMWGNLVIANEIVYSFSVDEYAGYGVLVASDIITGNLLWRWQPEEGFYFSNFVVSDGMLYLTYIKGWGTSNTSSLIIAFENP